MLGRRDLSNSLNLLKNLLKTLNHRLKLSARYIRHKSASFNSAAGRDLSEDSKRLVGIFESLARKDSGAICTFVQDAN